MGLVQKAFSDIITFSRSSNATRVGPTGRVEYAPHNLFTYSEDLVNAAWGASTEVTVSSNVVAAPNGTVTADKVIEAANTGAHRVLRSNVSVNAVSHTTSMYAKAAERTWLFMQNPYETNAQAWFNLSTGTIGTIGSGATATMQSVGNGWYRCSITATSTISIATTYFGPTTGNGVITYTGDGTSGIYIWGAQLSVGPYPLDYTPTTSAAVYGPRFDYDPVTLAARGLLVEEQRTNLLTYSEQFDNAAWTTSASAMSVTANAIASPDGTTTADLAIPTTANSNHFLRQDIASLTNGATYTVSVFAKAGGYNRFDLLGGYGSSTGGAAFDLSSGTVTSGTGQIVAFGNGWYRCSTQLVMSGTTLFLLFRSLSSAGASSFAGDGTSGVYYWGAQLESGSFATSLIPTIASTVTRSADVASVNTLSPWFNATTGTLYTEFDSIGFRSNNNEVARFNDGTVNNQLGIAANGTPSIVFEVTSGGVDQAAITGSSISANIVYKAAASFAANSFALSVGGALAGTDTSGTVPTVSALKLMNRSDGLRAMNGHLRRLSFYPRVLSTAELNALTA